MARQIRQANQRLNFKPKTSASGMWQFPTNPDHCCIYRVPDRIRKINPSAYTPQLLILGPLHHSLKIQALKSRVEDIENTRFMGYLSMEQHKEIYLLALAQRFGVEDIIHGFRSVIIEEEKTIRASYSESTAWIESKDFVEMILHDSVFILEFILRHIEKAMSTENSTEKTGDILIDEPSLYGTIEEDMVLLENQLPYFILEKLFEPIIKRLFEPIIKRLFYPFFSLTFRKIIIIYFGMEGKMNDNSEFKHFTDLLRCVRVDSLKLEEGAVNGVGKYQCIKHMYNAEKLHNGGIKFKVMEEELSLDVKFENGCLEVPFFEVDDSKEMILRNIMALEQCHYPRNAYVCNFVRFLEYLIDTQKDVDFLADEGIIKNRIGDHGVMADMVNKLSLGMIDSGSNYCYDITLKIEAHYKNPFNKSCTLLKRVYFKDIWTGTATIAAIFLLLMTLIQTIASIMQVLQKN